MNNFTPGPWYLSKNGGAIVSDWHRDIDEDLQEYYGGDVICETVGRQNSNIIIAAPELYEICKEFCERVERGEVRSSYTYGKMKEILKKIDEDSERNEYDTK